MTADRAAPDLRIVQRRDEHVGPTRSHRIRSWRPTALETPRAAARRWTELCADHRTILNLGLSGTGIAAVALTTLVVQNWLTDEPVTALQAILTAVSLLVGALLMWTQSQVIHTRGTLYYLRMQNESADDRHGAEAGVAAKSHLGYRSITTWFDPGPGDVDVRVEVRAMVAELQQATNGDNDESGFHLAPNLLFPIALAVGYEWAQPREVELLEFVGDSETFRFRPTCACATGLGDCGTAKCPSTDSRAGVRQTLTPHYRVNGRNSRSPQEAPFLGAHDRFLAPTDAATPVSQVWLNLHLTNGIDRVKLPDELQPDIKRQVGLFNPANADPTASALLRVVTSPSHPRAGHEMHPQAVAEAAACWINRTLDDFPEATILVTAQMPKTVAMLTGWLIGNTTRSRESAHPWRRLVPYAYFQGEDPAMRPMWVRKDQVKPSDRLTLAKGPGVNQ